MASYLKPRRGTYSTAASKLTSSNVLKNGEIFFELNASGAGKGVGKIKMGDGSTNYSNLPYFLSLQDSTITFTANESTDQISSLVSGVTIPNAFRYIKSSLAYLKKQVTNLNNEIVKRKVITKTINNQSHTVITKSELNIGEVFIIDVNIQRDPSLGYHFVTGHGVDNSGNLYVYFDGVINATLNVFVHYRIIL